MATPSLAYLMRARHAGITPEDMTPEQLAEAEAAEMRNRAVPQPAPWGGRRGAPVGQTVSPNVFGPVSSAEDRDLIEMSQGANTVYTNDPAAVGNVSGSVDTQSPAYLRTVRKQFEDLSAQTGAPLPRFSEDGMTMVGSDGYPVDLRDQDLVAEEAARRMGYRPPQPAATLPIAAAQPVAPAKDVIEGLALKSAESDTARRDYYEFPAVIRERFGLDGVNLDDLSIGEKLTLRRMGVTLPAPERSRRRKR